MAIEYGLLTALVAIGLIGSLTSMSGSISSVFTLVSTNIMSGVSGG